MTKGQLSLLFAVFVLAFVVRIVSLPTQPFFCDVPASLRAIESGRMVIQFPGYAPFHWVVRIIGDLLGNPLSGAVLYSLLCGLGAMVYCTLFAFDRAGFRGALLAATFLGFSPISIYFSCVGASYTTDLLGMSAVIYHGNRLLVTRNEGDYRCVVLWFVFGCLMRTLSFWFLGFGVLYLLWNFLSRRTILFTVGVSLIGAILFWAPTAYYYGNLPALRKSLVAPTGAGFHDAGLVWLAENEVRNVLFLVWSMNVFVFVIIGFLWFARKSLNRPLTTYFLLLTVPYFCFLLWYNCHAGYICLLFPAFACAPWLAEKRGWFDSRAGTLAIVFAIISLGQFFGPRPVPFTGKISLVLNTYVLTYTREGIRMGMFDNLQDWAKRYHLHG